VAGADKPSLWALRGHAEAWTPGILPINRMIIQESNRVQLKIAMRGIRRFDAFVLQISDLRKNVAEGAF
jgi:hypothetical protein